MKCYNHSNIDSVTQCQDCSKGLCKECSEIYDTPMCSRCAYVLIKKVNADARLRLSSIKEQIIKNLLVLIWVLIFISLGAWTILSSEPNSEWVFIFLILFAIGGLPWAINTFVVKKSITKDEIHKLRQEISQQNNNFAMLFVMFTKLIMGILASAIAAPIIAIYTMWVIMRLLSEKAEMERIIKDTTPPDAIA